MNEEASCREAKVVGIRREFTPYPFLAFQIASRWGDLRGGGLAGFYVGLICRISIYGYNEESQIFFKKQTTLSVIRPVLLPSLNVSKGFILILKLLIFPFILPDQFPPCNCFLTASRHFLQCFGQSVVVCCAKSPLIRNWGSYWFLSGSPSFCSFAAL